MSEEELKEIEEFAKDGAGQFDDLRQPVLVLVDEVRRLREALAAAQWGACDGCGRHYYCPLCGAEKEPLDEETNTFVVEGRHLPDCVIWKALGQLPPPPEGSGR